LKRMERNRNRRRKQIRRRMNNIDLIKKIRSETGAGVVDIKKALDEAKNNPVKAKELLKKRGLEIVAKKSSRNAGQGIIESYVHLGKIGVLVEVNCETDFVGRNEEFISFAHDLAVHIAASEAKNIDELMKESYFKDETQTIEDVLNALVAKIGEKIVVKRFTKFVLGE